MGRFAHAYGPGHPEATYIPHTIPEPAVRHWGGRDQLRCCWTRRSAGAAPDPRPIGIVVGYEPAMPLLAQRLQAFAVDLRGQGRSTRTPGRYTLDNMGNDLVRFIDGVIRRPTIVSGLSSGGMLSAWLSA